MISSRTLFSAGAQSPESMSTGQCWKYACAKVFRKANPYGERHFTETETKITFVSVLARHQYIDLHGNTKIPTRITKTMSLHQQQYYYTTVEKQNKVSLHLQQYYYATLKSHVTCRSRRQPTMMNQVILISRSGICSTPASITDIYVSWWKACKGREAFLLHMSMKAFQIVLGEVWGVMCDGWRVEAPDAQTTRYEHVKTNPCIVKAQNAEFLLFK